MVKKVREFPRGLYLCGMNYPADFLNSFRVLEGEEREAFFHAMAQEAQTSIRLNPLKTTRNPLPFSVPVAPVPWSRWGYYLDERPSFTFDPLFHSGYYYAQEASSMFIGYLVSKLLPEPSVCLDLCGAPGGKTLSALSALPEGSLLVSNEVARPRSLVLAETVTKSGYSNAMVTNNQAKDFSALPSFFNLILVDAPCSGEGMFRKEENALAEWSLSNVAMCAARQRDIARDIWPALKPGGFLVYSTCTFNTTENEDNVVWLSKHLGADVVHVEFLEDWGIAPSASPEIKGYRFFPHRLKGEGLFVSVLQKNESATGPGYRLRKANTQRTSKVKGYADFRKLLKNPSEFQFWEEGNAVKAFPSLHADKIVALRSLLKVVSAGIDIGEWKGRDFIPSHALALSPEISPDAFPRFELSYDDAIDYLQRKTVVLPDAPKGFLLFTYGCEAVGFAKNLGNRANNLYPNDWRIRSSKKPGQPIGIFSLP